MTRLWVLSDLRLEAVCYPEEAFQLGPDFDVLVARPPARVGVKLGHTTRPLRHPSDLRHHTRTK